MKVRIPYAHQYLELDIPSSHGPEVLMAETEQHNGHLSEEVIVEQALSSSIYSPPLCELAAKKKHIVIVCSDHTRPVPSKFIIPPMLRELRLGNPNAQITLLIATGMHRPTTHQELIEKFGEKIVEQENIVIHNCHAQQELCEIGILPSGAPLVINKLAAKCDLLLSEGFIEPHFFAGFSGGRKSVLPGICGYETVLGNHCASFIADRSSRTGNLTQNLIHKDMIAAARMAKLEYIVNVILDDNKKIVAAVAGHTEYAHAAGIEFLQSRCCVTPKLPGDIVITSNGGAPLDQNLYQAVKGLTAAEAAAAPNAVLIICASCSDGMGGDDFYQALHQCHTPAELLADIEQRPQCKTQPDQWETQILARILSKFTVILVCDEKSRNEAQQMKLETAATLDEAFNIAVMQKGNNSHVVVIPDGISVIVEKHSH